MTVLQGTLVSCDNGTNAKSHLLSLIDTHSQGDTTHTHMHTHTHTRRAHMHAPTNNKYNILIL